ncbi:endonuclease domain-containing protein [Prauserella flavalba]|uniref:endonuclease domain-containing protein n=1 Tax=Prauserella flavalba TaxID=1477506 RepID=UPI0036E3A498
MLVDPRRAADFVTRAAACLLGAGSDAVLTSHSALAVHGCSVAETAPIHILVPYRSQPRRRAGMVLHHGVVDPQDVEVICGLRVLALDVAVAEVLSRGTRRAGIACADQALRLVAQDARAEFRAWVEERIRSRADPRGRRQARGLLDLATGLAESPAESWTLLVFVDADLPVPKQQYRITDLAGDEIYRLDFAWPEPRVAVEYDGYEAHESRQEADAARDADLERRGWIVIRADAADLKDPGRLIGAVRAAFRRRGLAA